MGVLPGGVPAAPAYAPGISAAPRAAAPLSLSLIASRDLNKKERKKKILKEKQRGELYHGPEEAPQTSLGPHGAQA